MEYQCIMQHDITDCGAACIATICKQNGYKISITRIREVAGTDKQDTNVLYSLFRIPCIFRFNSALCFALYNDCHDTAKMI